MGAPFPATAEPRADRSPRVPGEAWPVVPREAASGEHGEPRAEERRRHQNHGACRTDGPARAPGPAGPGFFASPGTIHSRDFRPQLGSSENLANA